MPFSLWLIFSLFVLSGCVISTNVDRDSEIFKNYQKNESLKSERYDRDAAYTQPGDRPQRAPIIGFHTVTFRSSPGIPQDVVRGHVKHKGLKIVLLDNRGKKIALTSADDRGNWSFSGLKPQIYEVTVQSPFYELTQRIGVRPGTRVELPIKTRDGVLAPPSL